MGFELIEDITMADVAFRITGENLHDLFSSGAQALLSLLIESPENIMPVEERKAVFDNTEIDLLLFDFLQEIIFFKDSESLILLPASMAFSIERNRHVVECTFSGERIDPGKHVLNLDVKAVTMHNLSATKTGSGWSATFVLDV